MANEASGDIRIDECPRGETVHMHITRVHQFYQVLPFTSSLFAVDFWTLVVDCSSGDAIEPRKLLRRRHPRAAFKNF